MTDDIEVLENEIADLEAQVGESADDAAADLSEEELEMISDDIRQGTLAGVIEYEDGSVLNWELTVIKQ